MIFSNVPLVVLSTQHVANPEARFLADPVQ